MKSLMMKENLGNEKQEACSISNCPPYAGVYQLFDTDILATAKPNQIKIICDNSHSHVGEFNKGKKNVFRIVIGLQMAYVLTEFIAGFTLNSTALLTDAVHNLTDVASLVISSGAFWIAKKQSSAGYTYGFKKATVLAALLMLLFCSLQCAFLAMEYFHDYSSRKMFLVVLLHG